MTDLNHLEAILRKITTTMRKNFASGELMAIDTNLLDTLDLIADEIAKITRVSDSNRSHDHERYEIALAT